MRFFAFWGLLSSAFYWHYGPPPSLFERAGRTYSPHPVACMVLIYNFLVKFYILSFPPYFAVVMYV